jgi:hypothetical protein
MKIERRSVNSSALVRIGEPFCLQMKAGGRSEKLNAGMRIAEPFIVHPSSFILHRSSFILHPSAFILTSLD